jgi:hypothetical protein
MMMTLSPALMSRAAAPLMHTVPEPEGPSMQ